MELCSTLATFWNRSTSFWNSSTSFRTIIPHTTKLHILALARFRRSEKLHNEILRKSVQSIMSAAENIDPRDLNAARKVFGDEKSFHVYSKTWLDFVSFAGLNVEKPPVESNFEQYIEHKRSQGRAGSTMRCIYSHLNKFLVQLYNKHLKVSKMLRRKNLLFSPWIIF